MSETTNPQREHGWWDSIPKSIRKRPQWVVTVGKSPVKPSTGWNEPDKQFSFSDALRLADRPKHEPAYVLHADDPYVVIDMDGVGPDHPTKVSDEAAEIVERLDTYTEASRSDTGLHLVCRGTRLPNRCESGDLDDRGRIEVFDGKHYVVLTGNQISPYDTIRDGHNIGEENEDVLRDIQQEYLPTGSDPSTPEPVGSDFDLESISTQSVDLRVEDIRRTMEEYAKGGSDEAQRALDRWDSFSGSDLGFQSASEADLAFTADLAFWCREDARLVDDCFRASNRMRPKWDEVHYKDGRTYGDGTVQTAVRTNYDTFGGNYVQHR